MRRETAIVASNSPADLLDRPAMRVDHQVLRPEDDVIPVVEGEQQLDHLRVDQLDRKALVARVDVEAIVELDRTSNLIPGAPTVRSAKAPMTLRGDTVTDGIVHPEVGDDVGERVRVLATCPRTRHSCNRST